MRLIFATSNVNKYKEIKSIISDKINCEILCIKDFGIVTDVEESGTTFTENADIKVKGFYEALKNSNKLKDNDFIIADDTGLCIKYLNDAPGIHSARFMGKETPQDIKNKEIINLMKGADDRSAYFVTVLSMLDTKNLKIYHFEGKVDGYIAEKIEGTNGFGYDPIFIVSGVSYSNMGFDGKNMVSHRKLALNLLMDFLEKSHKI